MKKLIFLLSIIIFCYGCKKDNSFNYSSNLIGRWSWFSTCGGASNTGCWTPDAVHPSHDIGFTSESVYNIYYNDTLRFSSIYHTYKSVSEDGKYTTYLIKYDSGGQELFSITHDTLTIVNSEGILTTTSRYIKIN